MKTFHVLASVSDLGNPTFFKQMIKCSAVLLEWVVEVTKHQTELQLLSGRRTYSDFSPKDQFHVAICMQKLCKTLQFNARNFSRKNCDVWKIGLRIYRSWEFRGIQNTHTKCHKCDEQEISRNERNKVSASPACIIRHRRHVSARRYALAQYDGGSSFFIRLRKSCLVLKRKPLYYPMVFVIVSRNTGKEVTQTLVFFEAVSRSINVLVE